MWLLLVIELVRLAKVAFFCQQKKVCHIHSPWCLQLSAQYQSPNRHSINVN